MRLSKRCSKCITSQKQEPLAGGLCQSCRSYVPVVADRIHRQQPKLDQDVVVLMSGGKDSCYLLSRIREQNPDIVATAIFVDNGFAAKQAIENAIAICKATNTDLVISRRHTPMLMWKLRNAFIELGKTNGFSYSVVDFSDGSEVFHIGQKEANGRMVVTGLSREQAIQHGGGAVVETGLGVMVSPLVAWNPSDEQIYRRLEVKHGLSRKRFDPSITNHDLIPVMCAIDVKNHGYCSFEKEFSNRVRRNEANRKKWLHTFEFLEWSASRGLMDGMIETQIAKLDLKMEDVVKK